MGPGLGGLLPQLPVVDGATRPESANQESRTAVPAVPYRTVSSRSVVLAGLAGEEEEGAWEVWPAVVSTRLTRK